VRQVASIVRDLMPRSRDCARPRHPRITPEALTEQRRETFCPILSGDPCRLLAALSRILHYLVVAWTVYISLFAGKWIAF